MMYFAQGIPQGLLGIAIPAWLASQGVGAGEIASYLAVIALAMTICSSGNSATQFAIYMSLANLGHAA